jgi:hypothetical protein
LNFLAHYFFPLLTISKPAQRDGRADRGVDDRLAKLDKKIQNSEQHAAFLFIYN